MTTTSTGTRLFQAGLAAAAVLIWACTGSSGDDEGGGTGSALERDLLQSLADDAIAPSYEAFAIAAADLRAATQTHAQSMDVDSLEAARQAWVDAMTAWQVVEQMQLGPTGTAGVRIGGESLRDEVYSWPSTNTCRVDQELVLAEYDQADFVETRLVNAYGLDAIEYLLFYDGAENSCPPQLPINADGEWEALDAEGLAQRRADYAAAAASAVEATALELVEIWGSDGTWTAHLRNAGDSGSEYRSASEALDEVFAAMFYVDKQLKDAKLAKPAGILDCSSDTCLGDLEFQYAHASKEAAVANAEGLARLYYGGTDRDASIGFDDLLTDLGADSLRADVDAAIDESSPMLAIDGTYRQALLDNPAALDGPHNAVKRITDLFKGEFAMVLSLTIPQEGAGDAD